MSRRLVALTVVSLSITALSGTARAQQRCDRDLQLFTGGQERIPAQGIRNFSEGRPGIADIRVTPDEFVIVGLAEGSTTLLMINADGTETMYCITVRSPERPPASVRQEHNIRLDFYFVQVAESYVHQIGIAFPSAIGGSGSGGAGSSGSGINVAIDLLEPQVLAATMTLANIPLPRIDLLQATGWARVVRQVALVTENRQNATYNSGGEVNVVTAGQLSGGVSAIEFGSNLTVQPVYDDDTGRIQLRVRAEVSDLTEDRGTGAPGRNVSTLDTRVNLAMGQSVVLGGLISHSRAQGRNGLPGLSQIPLIGALFGSHTRRWEASQNVLFIIPTVVDPVSDSARRLITEAFRVYWDYSGDLEEIQMLPIPPNVPSAAEPGAVPIGTAPAAAPAAPGGR